MRPLALFALLQLLAVAGCGGSPGYAQEGWASGASVSTPSPEMASGGESAPAQYAQAATGGEATATDATTRPLLIYTADLGLAVHEVTQQQDRIEALARELGGFLASRTDDTIVIRVPAAGFQSAMDQIQALGDVISRRIEVQDVTEEFRDLETRITTLEAMRRRVEELLRQANDVQAALAVEQQLERITIELERLRGRLRYLGDRVAFSTITVRFTERADTAEPDFQLPFGWLQNLGLQRLLQL